jgi:uncharacterized membrane protein YphA (DoxX/SURF4 family)
MIRLCLADTLLVHASQLGPLAPLFWWVPILVLIVAALGAGLMTGFGCFLYCTAEIAFLVSAKNFDLTILILNIPVAIALALLGPGAYSLDARIFGRRVIKLPPGKHT